MTDSFLDKLKRGQIDLGRFLLPPIRRKQKPVSPFGFPYASFNRRMLAAMVDSMLLLIVFSPISNRLVDIVYGPLDMDWNAVHEAVQAAPTPQAQESMRMEMLAQAGFFTHWTANFVLQGIGLALYTFIFWRMFSATPGKVITRTRIIRADNGLAMSPAHCLVRLAGYGVSAAPLFLGFFWIAFDKKRQGWHDKLAGTYVVALPWRKAKAQDSTGDEKQDLSSA